MKAARLIPMTLAMALFSAAASAQASDEPSSWRIEPDVAVPASPSVLLQNRDELGLPGARPRLTMRMPLNQRQSLNDADSRHADRSAFSWSLEAWQLNTASLAHIQCDHHTLTIDSFVAEDCRFVDQPLPENSVNLVQVRGEWMAAPGLRFGAGAYHGQQASSSPSYFSPTPLLAGFTGLSPLAPFGSSQIQDQGGLDLNMSFGISTERVGDFLVGLQLARYRQRMSMVELGLVNDPMAGIGHMHHYANSAQLSLGWRRGSFGGDLMGQYRDAPIWSAGGANQASFNSFDLEFSWRPRNGSLSIGISNVLDASPRLDEPEASLEDPMEHVFGRIPYVRYKHDL
jgi:hypothetical protein